MISLVSIIFQIKFAFSEKYSVFQERAAGGTVRIPGDGGLARSACLCGRSSAFCGGHRRCGKSTLIRKFASSLPKEKYIFLYLSDSKLIPRWFYKGLLDQLGLESKFYRGETQTAAAEGDRDHPGSARAESRLCAG